jgi:hypothetical protein
MLMMYTALISLSPWDLQLCHVRTHTGTIKIPTCWLPEIICLLVGLQSASHRAVNFDKFRKVIQSPTENPTDFLGRLTETLTCYTKLDPSSGQECLFSTPTLFPSPPLIFEKNLNRQRVALNHPFPQRYCENGI